MSEQTDPVPGPVRPPWWNDPSEQGNEIARSMVAIAARLENIVSLLEQQNRLLTNLPAEIEGRVRGAGIGSLAGLLRRQ